MQRKGPKARGAATGDEAGSAKGKDGRRSGGAAPVAAEVRGEAGEPGRGKAKPARTAKPARSTAGSKGGAGEGPGARGRAEGRSAKATYPELKKRRPRQAQAYPGSTEAMHPKPDHGEASYRGSGKLTGRRALITGGDSGIGRAVAIAFAREGADVAIVFDRSVDDAAETCRWVEDAGRRAVSIQLDLRSREACREAVARTVRELGGLDVLVNNAAFHEEVDDLRELTDDQLRRTFEVNVFAPFWLTQAALDHLGDGGSILNTGSVVALDGSPGLPDYAATKGALHNFTRTMATALAKDGIRVNCVAPGPVWTPLVAYGRKADKVPDFGKDTAWGRPAQPAELAPSYVFLASDDGRYYTGEVFAMTGRSTTR